MLLIILSFQASFMQTSEQVSYANLHSSAVNQVDQLVAAHDEPALSDADVKKAVMQQVSILITSHEKLKKGLVDSGVLKIDKEIVTSHAIQFEKLINLSRLFLRAEGWYTIAQLHAELLEQLLIVEQGLYEINNILPRQVDIKSSKFRQSRRKAYSDWGIGFRGAAQPQDSSSIVQLAKSLDVNPDESADVSSDENTALGNTVQPQNLLPTRQLAKSLDVRSDEISTINSSKQVAAVRVELRHVLYGLTGLAAAVATYYGVKKGTVRTIYGPDRVGVVAALTGQ